MVTESTTMKGSKDLFGIYAASEILPRFLELIRRGQGEAVAAEPVIPEIARDFEAFRQALLSVDLLPLLIEIAVNQEVSYDAGQQQDVRENRAKTHFVSQLISYVSGPTGITLLNAWTYGIQEIAYSSTYQNTIVGALETYGTSLIARDRVSEPDLPAMRQNAVYDRLRSTHENLREDLALVFHKQQWDEDLWKNVATKKLSQNDEQASLRYQSNAQANWRSAR